MPTLLPLMRQPKHIGSGFPSSGEESRDMNAQSSIARVSLQGPEGSGSRKKYPLGKAVPRIMDDSVECGGG
jgi:hypothetical protein